MRNLLILSALILIQSNEVAAFDKNGHKAIEQRAYELLEHYAGLNTSGIQIIQALKYYKILADDYPTVRSHYPDLSLERQFAQNRQMYHFMASNHDVIFATKVSGPFLQQQQLLINSLGSCLRMMYLFFREIVECPLGSSQAGRGVYVLIHIVADSYSSEHTARDSATAQLITIKGWQLSRLCWPASAKSKTDDKGTLSLLHSVKGRGDHQWYDSTTKQLTPLADSAAYAIRDLLITLYLAKKSPEKADVLIREYFEKHFRPLTGTMTGSEFVFSNTSKVIPYTYDNDYISNKSSVTFDYDRFPGFSVMITTFSALSRKQFIKGYGVEFAKYVTPKAADNPKSIFQRIPYGFGGSLSRFVDQGSTKSFGSLLRLKGFYTPSFALPLINASLEPHVGMAAFPFSNSAHLSFVWGGDLVWSIGDDWVLPYFHAPKTLRLAIGYEYDNAGPVMKSMVKLKIGYNTWHGRVVKCGRKGQ